MEQIREFILSVTRLTERAIEYLHLDRGGGASLSNELLGLCRWMGWGRIFTTGLTTWDRLFGDFSIDLLERVRTFSGL